MTGKELQKLLSIALRSYIKRFMIECEVDPVLSKREDFKDCIWTEYRVIRHRVYWMKYFRGVATAPLSKIAAVDVKRREETNRMMSRFIP